MQSHLHSNQRLSRDPAVPVPVLFRPLSSWAKYHNDPGMNFLLASS